MSNPIIVIPDVHGRTFWEKVINSNLPIIFLGDYLDPYPHEKISPKEALENFKEIIKFAKERPDDVILLMGNHTDHYCGISDISSRFDYEHFEEIYNLIKENQSLFQWAFQWDNVLFTHAGVSNRWLEEFPEYNDATRITELLNSNHKLTDYYVISQMKHPWDSINPGDPVGKIGWDRGGWGAGGPEWCDLRSLVINPAFQDSLIQIVSHTQFEKDGFIWHEKNVYACDSREAFVWTGDNLVKFDDYGKVF